MDRPDYRRSNLKQYLICAECVEEADLQQFIADADGEPGCSFCEQTDAPTCKFTELMEHVSACLEGEYGHAVNWLPYESAEGGWLSEQYWDTPDLITEELGIGLPRDDHGALLQAMVDGLGGLDDWCVDDPYGDDPLDALRAGWTRFCTLIKFETRFFLDRWRFSSTQRNVTSEGYSPAQILRAIGDRTVRLELSKKLDKGTLLYRVRKCDSGVKFASPADLGPPPHEAALLSNRMSPPGIVMIYAALDADTALAETVDEKEGLYAIGQFRTLRPANLLDLTHLPRVPGFFQQLPDSQPWTRRDAQFFHSLVEDLSRPIARDNHIHVEYIPTQVFTEYCRLALHHDHETTPFEGILYPSSRHAGYPSVVLFADQRAIHGATEDDALAWIELAAVSYHPTSMS